MNDQTGDQFFKRYDLLIQSAIEDRHVPGVSIAVVEGSATFEKSYGIARYPDEEVRSSTLFNAASMTKAQIAACLSLLVDERPDVQWSTPVSQLLDDFVLSDHTYTRDVTIEDILSHRSGLPDQDDACLGVNSQSPDSPRTICRKLRHLPLTASLRSEFQYCNVMYVIAVHLIETLSGTTLNNFLHERLWKPLGMNDSYSELEFVKQASKLHQVSKGYDWDSDKDEIFEVPWPEQPEAVGAGEVISTAGNYARFLRCMIDRSRPISESGHKELIKPRTIVDTPPNPFWSQELYALGWETTTYHGEPVVSHSGSTDGFGCKMMFLPNKKWGVVVMGNTSNASEPAEKICWAMVDDLLNIAPERRFDWDTFWAKEEEEEEHKTVEKLYPSIPDPRIPHILPLESYVGTYWHPGYGNWIVQLKDEKLVIDARDRTWQSMLTFQHVSGEFFAIERLHVNTRYKDLIRAEFRTRADGTIDQLGIDLVQEMKGVLLWLQRTPLA